MARDSKPEDLQPYSPYLGGAWVPGVYDPDHSYLPYHPEEHRRALFAQPSPCLIGGRVMYRHELHGDVTDAVVMAVDYDSPESAYVPSPTGGEPFLVRLPPWPTLTLDTLYGPVRTREARNRGSAGWLPVGWHEPVGYSSAVKAEAAAS